MRYLLNSRSYADLTLAVLTLATLECRSPSESHTSITFWAFGAEGDHVEKLISEFERRHPQIKVRVQRIPWIAAHEKLLTAYAGDSMPDLFQLGNTWVPEFVMLGALEPLDNWVDHSNVISEESYFPGIWETNNIDGHLYGVPWYVDTRVLYYRTDILARAGVQSPPKTWEELFAACKQIKGIVGGEESYPILLPTNEWAPQVILGMQAGSSLLKDGGRYGDFSGAEFRKGFSFYASFFREGFAPTSVTRMRNVFQGFADGYFAMYISGPWYIGEFQGRLPQSVRDKWMTSPLPGPDERTPGVSLAGGSSLVILAASNKKAEAWKLIEYLSEPAQEVTFYQLTGDLPPRKEAWQHSAFRNNPYAQAFFQQLEYVQPMPRIPEWEQIATKVQDYAEVAALNRMSVDEVLAALDDEVNVILEKRRWLLERR